ncbi:mitochondrial glycoprotein [Atractiella rhizophila]|nr:mitochondrial glycoprotein [Atractiella rhizophila]
MLRTASRSLARAAFVPRAAARLATPLPRSFVVPQLRTFATTPFRSASSDPELLRKLESEFKHEQESEGGEKAEVPEKVQELAKDWKFIESSLSEKVTLTRSIGDETVTLEFLVTIPEDEVPQEEMSEDELAAEEEPAASLEKKMGARGQTDVLPEEQEEFEGQEPYPLPIDVTIEKKGISEVLNFKVSLSDGVFVIEQVLVGKSKEILRNVDFDPYAPAFNSLDDALQGHFYAYLEERGIDEALAQALPEYCDWKEQKEYVNWLSNVRDFVKKQ